MFMIGFIGKVEKIFKKKFKVQDCSLIYIIVMIVACYVASD